MDNLFFFPTITKQMINDADCQFSDYEFSYYLDGNHRLLKPKGSSTLKLVDALETWKIENDGLRIVRHVSIGYPEVFKGSKGVACAGASLGMCIIWYSRKLKQMGYIMPYSQEKNGISEEIIFVHEFPAGEICDDISLSTVMYIKSPAKTIEEDELHLINEAGVTVGELDSVTISFSDSYMDFPIMEVNDPDRPLWWLELNQWEDPRKDPFDEDYVCLYLNAYHDACPKISNDIKNYDVLIEIIATSYLMIIEKLEDNGYLNDTVDGSADIESGSISDVIHHFLKSGIFDFGKIDNLHFQIHQTVESMMGGNIQSDAV